MNNRTLITGIIVGVVVLIIFPLVLTLLPSDQVEDFAAVFNLFVFGIIFLILLAVARLFGRKKLGWTNVIQHRTKPDQVETYLAELLAKYESGDQSLETLVGISFAYKEWGKLQDAERFAQQARTEADRGKYAYKRDKNSRLAAEMAYLALASTWCLQGRFGEAAHELHQFFPSALRKNHVMIYTAWLYFLAGEEDHAREILTDLHPINRMNDETIVSPAFHFIALYLQMEVLDQDTRKQLIQQREQISVWNDELQSYQGTPYSERLGAILRDMRAITDVDAETV